MEKMLLSLADVPNSSCSVEQVPLRRVFRSFKKRDLTLQKRRVQEEFGDSYKWLGVRSEHAFPLSDAGTLGDLYAESGQT